MIFDQIAYRNGQDPALIYKTPILPQWGVDTSHPTPLEMGKLLQKLILTDGFP
jgi:hypothetical protein